MRAPDLSGLVPEPQEPAQPAAPATTREPTVREAARRSSAGASAWADALLGARVRSEPRSPSVPDLGIDDLSGQTFTTSAPPAQRAQDATPRGFKTAGRRGDARAADSRPTADVAANPIGRALDPTLGDESPMHLPHPRQRPLLSDFDDAPTGDNPRTSAIGGLIEASLDDDPVSEVGPVLLQDGPARTDARPAAARPSVDAPWGLDDERPGALPPLGAAVNSLSMTRGDDSVSLATLEGSEGESEATAAQAQRSGGPRSALMGVLVGLGVAAGMSGLWLWQRTAAPPSTVEQADPPAAHAPPPATSGAPTAKARSTEPAAREEPAHPTPTPQPETTGGVAAAGAEPAQPALPEAVTPEPAPSEQAVEPPPDLPSAAAGQGPALEQARALVDQAVYLRNNGRERDAITNYERALELQRGYGRAMAGLARVYLAKQDGERALYWAKRLNRNQPPGRDNQLLLGDAHQLAGNTEAARAAWTQAASLGSASAQSRLGQ